jgi:putative phosphoesterase
MKLGILGDIHGNDGALSAVLKAASKAKVDRLLVTGDLVGYYFSPRQVLNLLDDWNCDIVSGNHELMLVRSRSNPDYLAEVSKRYGSGLRVAIEQLDAQQLDRLCSLPHPLELNIDGIRILLCHGSPWDVDHYVYPDSTEKAMKFSESGKYNVIVMGHTHYPMLFDKPECILVNPGSVGQPRDRMPGACWALFDTESYSIELRREDYDSSELVRECQLRHPELPYLANVLMRSI